MSEITVTLSRRQVDRPAPESTRALRGLQELPEGAPALIARVCDGSDAACARRLFDLGFAPGARVEKVRHAPFGGPAVYRVADYEIALRPAQARTILVETLPADPPSTGSTGSVGSAADTYATRSVAA
ncbi:FeoA family protein [Raineyella sp.]|uniref:FeoA family protein n=1 Tax=Raineyella sp. TaxID=1911550 RepID=UPI002B2042E2|nr:FeoA family protein [Raineyella sp.]MEA5153321.1 FeoA family protein [Raineyella sp.]